MGSSLRRRAFVNGVALVLIVLSAFPVYWMFTTSFRLNGDIRSPAPSSCRSAGRWRTTGRSSTATTSAPPSRTASR